MSNWLTKFINSLIDPHRNCYNTMENSGIAVFGMCRGLSGGTSATEYLSETCVDCPYFTMTQSNAQERKSKIIAVDFDGTLCNNKYPDIGEPNRLIIQRLHERQLAGDKVILWTCRVGEKLQDAIDWCYLNDIVFDEVNKNLPEIIESFGSDTRKIFANEYWDDRNKDIERFI